MSGVGPNRTNIHEFNEVGERGAASNFTREEGVELLLRVYYSLTATHLV